MCVRGGLGRANSCPLSRRSVGHAVLAVRGGASSYAVGRKHEQPLGGGGLPLACVCAVWVGSEKSALRQWGSRAPLPPPPRVSCVLDVSVQWHCAVFLWTTATSSSGFPADALGVQVDAVGVAGVWLEANLWL